VTGFSADWLALREPYDAAARDNAALAAVRDGLPGARPLRIADLGSGTGANMRYLAPRLGGTQRWRLIDDDPSLLTAARDRTAPNGVTVETLRHDLADPWARPSMAGMDLVTASALLDLVDLRFVGWLAGLVMEHRTVLHAALSYDGRLVFAPQDPFDADIHALFDAHQRTEKSFGLALGPDGWRTARDRLAEAGARVVAAESDWRIGPNDVAMQRTLLDGLAGAAIEMAPHRAAAVAGWHARRTGHLVGAGSGIVVGHVCLTALPPG
jgi:SAM-dependent methyltransferase